MKKNSTLSPSFTVFFEKPTSDLINIFEQSEKQCSAFFTQQLSLKCQTKISIIDDYLVVSQKIVDEYEPTMFKSLDQHLRLQKIKKAEIIRSKTPSLFGISLFNQLHQSVDLYFQHESILNIFIKRLSDLIMRLGFFEDYKIMERIGKGSTSVVYKIMRLQDNKIFAAKAVLKSYLDSKEQRRQSFNNEILILRALDHDNLLEIEQVYEQQTTIYVITELLQGGNLMDRINSVKDISLEQTKIIIRGIASGLSYMHKFDIMHRDIKLENIMFRDENSWEAIIVDFGLAAVSDDEPYTLHRCGTPGYIAPQIISMTNQQKIDVKCDIFSAGVILHILLTKRYLFQDSSSAEIYKKNKQLSFNLESQLYSGLNANAVDLMKSMLQMEVQQRISAQQMLGHALLQGPAEEKQDVSTLSSIYEYEWLAL